MKLKLSLSILFICFALLTGCSHTPPSSPEVSASKTPPPSPKTEKRPRPYIVNGKVYYPLGKVKDYKEKGVASWYGKDFHQKKTSCGEQYDMYANTAAHRILPFGTKVQVTNLQNRKKTVVVINDRGPFAKDRILDLSYTGAKEIGLVAPGTALVELEVIGVSDDYSTSPDWNGLFTVQIGSFKELKNALRLKEKMSLDIASSHINTYQNRDGAVFYQVRVGKYASLEETIRTQKECESKGFQGAFIIAE